MDEFFESMTLLQTQKTEPFQVILIGKAFWLPQVDWMRKHQSGEHPYISESDLVLFEVPDDVVGAAQRIKDFHQATLDSSTAKEETRPPMTAEGTLSGQQPQRPRVNLPYEDLVR